MIPLKYPYCCRFVDCGVVVGFTPVLTDGILSLKKDSSVLSGIDRDTFLPIDWIRTVEPFARTPTMSHQSSIRAVCVAGPSDAGKTTLVEQLVPRLAADARVGTVKSIHHDIEIDTPGADTHRHRSAGAETVVGITPELTFEVSTHGKRSPPETPAGLFESDDPEQQALATSLDRLARRGFDIVLVEGFSSAPLPTIVVGDRDIAIESRHIVGRGTDDIETLAETIRSLEPIEPGVASGRGSEPADS